MSSKDCIFRFNENNEIEYVIKEKEKIEKEINQSDYKIIIVNTKTNPNTILELSTSNLSDVFTSTILELISNVEF